MEHEQKKKQLRTTLSPIEFVFMLLMPVSQFCAWALVIGKAIGSVTMPLLDIVGGLCTFYGLWALKNRFFSNPLERAYYPFAIGCVGCFYFGENTTGRVVAAVGSLGVFLAFAIASTRVLVWPAPKLAYIAKKTLLWARIDKPYFVSSLLFWPVVIVLLLAGH